ncbi:MAG: hypothetical protein KatS3mg035_0591 [Bacteroidia bacterium]|jgi:hypothetical protein|nr:MAG: hypothetical protein KatS3mg035_0591 [Bacteroidia bacterium]
MVKHTIVLILFSLIVLTSCQKVEEQQNNQSLIQSEKQANNAVSDNAESKSEKESNTKLTKIEFEKDYHDFGIIKEGEKVSHVFKFKNVGTEPLIIKNVKPACGCTTPDWTKDPVPPGGEGKIEVSFDSQGRTGIQNKSVEVFANTDPEVHTLKFKGEVKK